MCESEINIITNINNQSGNVFCDSKVEKDHGSVINVESTNENTVNKVVESIPELDKVAQISVSTMMSTNSLDLSSAGGQMLQSVQQVEAAGMQEASLLSGQGDRSRGDRSRGDRSAEDCCKNAETAGMQGVSLLSGQSDHSAASKCDFAEADSGFETADAEDNEDTLGCRASHSTDTDTDTGVGTDAEVNMVTTSACTASHTKDPLLSLKMSQEILKNAKLKQSGKMCNQYEREYRLLHKRLGKE